MNKASNTSQLIWKKMAEDNLRQEFNQKLPGMLDRYKSINSVQIIPNHHFSSVSAECKLLFRDGHFYGCITLVQAVAEALLNFLCRTHGWKSNKKFEENIKKLSCRIVLFSQMQNKFLEIWSKRDDFHHLNVTIPKRLQIVKKSSKMQTQAFDRY